MPTEEQYGFVDDPNDPGFWPWMEQPWAAEEIWEDITEAFENVGVTAAEETSEALETAAKQAKWTALLLPVGIVAAIWVASKVL